MRVRNVFLRAPIHEIFSSCQGEGLYAGQRQVFVRFAGCNLRCAYCDTPKALAFAENQVFLSVEQIIQQIRKKADGPLRAMAVSLTGGEPLLYPEFLKELLRALKRQKMMVYLETKATLPEYLRTLVKDIDVIA